MLKSVYKKEKNKKSVEEQIIDIIRNDDKEKNMYDLKLEIITNIQMDAEHTYDILVLIYRHPHDYYYVYIGKVIGMKKIEVMHSPCGLIKAKPYKRGGPMFKENWISKICSKQIAELK